MKRLLLLLALAGLLASAWRLSDRAALPVPPPAQTQPSPADADADLTPALTVNGQPVPRWLCAYWLTRSCENAQKLAAGQGQASPPPAADPGSLPPALRDRAIADAALCGLVQDLCRTHCGPPDSAAPDPQGPPAPQPPADASSLPPDPGLPAGQARRLADYGRCYHRLQELATHPDSPWAPTPEQLAEVAKRGNFLAVDRIFVTGEDAPARIAALFAQLNQAPDPAALFPALAAQGADHTGPRTLRAGDGTLSPALEAAARSLEVGRHSGILADGDGCAILLRTPPDLRTLTQAWVDQTLLQALRTADIRLLPAFQSISIPLSPGPDTA